MPRENKEWTKKQKRAFNALLRSAIALVEVAKDRPDINLSGWIKALEADVIECELLDSGPVKKKRLENRLAILAQETAVELDRLIGK